MVRALEEDLNEKVTVPMHHEVMGAIGSALIAKREKAKAVGTKFYGFRAQAVEYGVELIECRACPSLCEIAQVMREGRRIAYWGGRCDLWESMAAETTATM